jgi:hypothetical protein
LMLSWCSCGEDFGRVCVFRPVCIFVATRLCRWLFSEEGEVPALHGCKYLLCCTHRMLCSPIHRMQCCVCGKLCWCSHRLWVKSCKL